MEGKIRAFLCVELPESIRQVVGKAEEPLREKHPDLKWVREANLHITLKFCGECSLETVGDFAAVYGRYCESGILSSFSLTLGSPDALPSLSRIGILCAGLEGQIQALRASAEKGEEAGERSGIERSSRPFLPHITLARTGRRPLSLLRGELPVFPPLNWTVTSIVLMKSILHPGGPEYFPLSTWPLGKRKE